jgi:hypothetical protein
VRVIQICLIAQNGLVAVMEMNDHYISRDLPS